MGEKRGVVRRIERAMDFPSGTLSKTAIIEVEGNRRVVVAGCGGIDSYTEECISLRTPDGAVVFYGSELEMGCLTPEGATIVGRLQRIEFET